MSNEESLHALESADVLNKLDCTKSGLSSTEAANRLNKYGPNQ